MVYDKRPIYLNIAYGQLQKYMGKNQEPKSVMAVEGNLLALKVVNKTIRTKLIDYLYVTMIDKEEDETYVIEVPLQSSAGPNIIRSLKSGLATTGSLIGKKVKIQPYPKEKDGIQYTNATLYLNGEKLPWADIPVNVNTRDAIAAMTAEIQAHLINAGGTAIPSIATPEEGEVNPFDEIVR